MLICFVVRIFPVSLCHVYLICSHFFMFCFSCCPLKMARHCQFTTMLLPTPAAETAVADWLSSVNASPEHPKAAAFISFETSFCH